jgi:hypothetical protein
LYPHAVVSHRMATTPPNWFNTHKDATVSAVGNHWKLDQSCVTCAAW